MALDAINGATLLKQALATEGLTDQMIIDLTTQRGEFDVAIGNQRKAEKMRNVGKQTRIQAGNDLYVVLVKFCNIGKNIWFGIDESKYNDYVIYGETTVPQIPPETQFGSLTGTTTSSEGVNLPLVDIEIVGTTLTTQSDEEDFTYDFDQVPVEATKIRAKYDGFYDYEGDILIANESESVHDIIMIPLPVTPPTP